MSGRAPFPSAKVGRGNCHGSSSVCGDPHPRVEQPVQHFPSFSRDQLLSLYLATPFFILLFGIETDPVIMRAVVAALDRKHTTVLA